MGKFDVDMKLYKNMVQPKKLDFFYFALLNCSRLLNFKNLSGWKIALAYF